MDESDARLLYADFDLSGAINDTVSEFQYLAEERGHILFSDIAPSLSYHGDEALIRKLAAILLDNAVKFCPREGTLGLTIREGENKAYISVSNEGQTIPPEELPLVFDRFHKLDKSRARNKDGWGLGLYIVKNLICRHGEDISVTSQNGVTTFTFTLPLVN